MKVLCLVLLAVCAVFAHEPAKKLYTGDKVLRLTPSKDDHHTFLQTLQKEADSQIYDFWSDPNGIDNAPVDIHVHKDAFERFAKKLDAMRCNYTVGVHDLQQLIDETEAPMRHRERRAARLGNRGTRASIVGTFPRYNDIVTWLSEQCTAYPKLATCGSIGTTTEKRDIRYIQLGAAGTNKKIIYFETGIHAREWLAPATMIYVINRLLTTYNTDAAAKRMLDKYDFIIVPSANPDGYEYSRTERMWRKTRSVNAGSTCKGVDPNRNFDFAWSTSGSSSQPCSDIYHGPKAFSEPETIALSNFVKARKDKMLAQFAVHCYAQMWLIPYADKAKNYAPNFSELQRVANIGKAALEAVNNKKWQAGNTGDILSLAAGGSDDWATSIGIKYSYTLELRPASQTLNGFVVKESEIEPSGKEVFAGVVAAIDAMQA